MSREVRIFAEGSLRWVQASGTGAWKTATSPISGLMGFVQAGTQFDSARNVATIRDRGVPHHHKVVSREPLEITFTYLHGVTADMANPATASGVSTPQVHLELKYLDDEIGSPTGQYFQFMNGIMLTRGWQEAEEGNQFSETWRFLSMTGPTASGYLG